MKKLILAACLSLAFAFGLSHAAKDTEIKVKGHTESCCKKADTTKSADANDCCKKAGTAEANDCCKKGHGKKDAKASAAKAEKHAHGASACCKKAGTADASECCKKHDAGVKQACCKKGTEKKS